jgi:dienelactone hydrolase
MIAGLNGESRAEIRGEAVEYKHGDALLEGYLAYDDSTEQKRPGIIVVHEWKGLNDYAKRRADQLAQMGYIAFAIDMYGKEVRPRTHEEAAEQSGIYRKDRQLMRERARAGFDVLKEHPLTDSTRMAAIGYCFGGTTVLEMARAGMDLKAVVSFHGALSTPRAEDARNIKSRVLVLHGAGDNFVPEEEVAGFKKEMDDAGVDWRFVAYEGAVHSFTVPEAGDDPSRGVAYNAEADEKSWQEMTQLFEEVFQP